MFRALANGLNPATGRATVLAAHPLRLSRWVEERWQGASLVPPFGRTGGKLEDVVGSVQLIGGLALPPPAPQGSGLNWPPGGTPLLWDHLIYAYLIESTGVVEIMAEVVRRALFGETLDEFSVASHQWLRTTEDLFFSDPPLFSIAGIGSHLRPDARVARRNAYWRMFALDLPHPIPTRWAPTGQPWKADVGNGVNTSFRQTWSDLLRQVWLGLENRRNTSGSNATDAQYVASLCKALGDMLRLRRRAGQLSREEMVFTTMLSWFHLTLEENTAIVTDLNAQASSPEERLARIGQRVGISPAPRSRELFELAELMSTFLRAIELRFFDSSTDAEQLYFDPPPPAAPANPLLRNEVNRLIDLWQSATGERVKEPTVKVASVSGTSQPLRLPAATPPPIAPSAAGNGAVNLAAAASSNGR